MRVVKDSFGNEVKEGDYVLVRGDLCEIKSIDDTNRVCSYHNITSHRYSYETFGSTDNVRLLTETEVTAELLKL